MAAERDFVELVLRSFGTKLMIQGCSVLIIQKASKAVGNTARAVWRKNTMIIFRSNFALIERTRIECLYGYSLHAQAPKSK
jgi:hypothetical protein